MVSKMKATFQRLGVEKNGSRMSLTFGWEVPMYFALSNTGRFVGMQRSRQEKVIQPLELKARDQRKRFWVTWMHQIWGDTCASLSAVCPVVR